MPCTPEAADVLRKANVLIAPSMAAGTGGVYLLLQFFSFILCAIYVISFIVYLYNN